jgi:chromosome segregation ATPase
MDVTLSREEFDRLLARISRLEQRNLELEERCQFLERQNAELEERCQFLERRNAELETEVARLRKNSSNSSKPPSSDGPGISGKKNLEKRIHENQGVESQGQKMAIRDMCASLLKKWISTSSMD